jgi:copper resistance protein B
MRTFVTLACALTLMNQACAAEDHSTHRHIRDETAINEPAGHDQSSDSSSQQTESAAEHVAPAPPTLTMEGMTDAQMNEMMEMHDNAAIGMVLLDHVEWRTAHGADALDWDASAFYGNDFNKLVLKSEGERDDANTDSSNELLWDRIVGRWWSSQTGLRFDTHPGKSRTWAALGIQGLAPNWFNVSASVYVGDQGRTALRLKSEYELLLTQRLILQPQLELNAYGQRDDENGTGSGLADTELSLRLRYEIRREFAPYVGLSWTRLLGDSATMARQRSQDPSEVQWVAGLRVWF